MTHGAAQYHEDQAREILFSRASGGFEKATAHATLALSYRLGQLCDLLEDHFRPRIPR